MALPTVFILSILSLILLPSPSAANEGNILATGDVLPTDGQLSYNDAAFVMQGDCNLVLYNNAKGFQSNTHGRGTNCTLTLSDYGKLIVKSGDGSQVWSSSGGKTKGNYIAILGPDGQVKVYGPSIWSIPAVYSSSAATDAELSSAPLVRNVLFSLEILDKKTKLASRDYSLELTDDCNLEFIKASEGVLWDTKTTSNEQDCFVRLDNHGQLAVVDNRYTVLWVSGPAKANGDYVLVVKIQGKATIYGPVVWSTGFSSFALGINVSK